MEIGSQYQIRQSGHLIEIIFSGTVSYESYLDYSMALKNIVQKTQTGKWAALVSLLDSNLTLPDTLPQMEKLVLWAVDHGLTDIAYVFTPQSIKAHQYYLEELDKISPDGLTQQSFFDVQEALNWLGDRGYFLLKDRD